MEKLWPEGQVIGAYGAAILGNLFRFKAVAGLRRCFRRFPSSLGHTTGYPERMQVTG
jgi:hypothetical protein